MRRPETREASMSFVVTRAREMRREPTISEAILWERLRRGAMGARFRRQHPLGDVILDFYAPSVRLAVEVDGSAHDAERDARRDAWLGARGIRAVRVKAWMVERHISVVLDVIRVAL